MIGVGESVAFGTTQLVMIGPEAKLVWCTTSPTSLKCEFEINPKGHNFCEYNVSGMNDLE